MNLDDWAYMLKRIGSKKTKNEIKTVIKRECLVSPNKVNGAYIIDNNKVWEKLVISDLDCKEGLERENIHDSIGIEAWLEEIKYREMWRAYRSSYRIRKR